jgi:hypothetical protein
MPSVSMLTIRNSKLNVYRRPSTVRFVSSHNEHRELRRNLETQMVNIIADAVNHKKREQH